MAKKCTHPDLSALTHGEFEAIVLIFLELQDVLESKVTECSRNFCQRPSEGGRKTNWQNVPSGSPPKLMAGQIGVTVKIITEQKHIYTYELPKYCKRCGHAHFTPTVTQTVDEKLHWLHAGVEHSHTWYGYGVDTRCERTTLVAQNIWPICFGILNYDCRMLYLPLLGVHALCNLYLSPESLHAQERVFERRATSISDMLLSRKELCEAGRRNNIVFGDAGKAAQDTFYDDNMSGEHKRRHLDGCCARVVKQSEAFNLLLRLRRYTNVVLLFVYDLAVSPTKIFDERVIGMYKVRQKVSDSIVLRWTAEILFHSLLSCHPVQKRSRHA